VLSFLCVLILTHSRVSGLGHRAPGSGLQHQLQIQDFPAPAPEPEHPYRIPDRWDPGP